MIRFSMLAALALTATGLTACGSPTQDKADAPPAAQAPVPPPAVEPAPVAAPAVAQTPAPRPAPGYDWHARTDDSERSRSMVLAYETPDTDDQPLNLSCEEGGQRIFAGLQTSTTGRHSFALASDGAGRAYPIKTAEAEEVMGGDYLTVELSGDDAVLAAFRRSGWLRLTVDGRTVDMAAHPDSGARARIAAFLDFCND